MDQLLESLHALGSDTGTLGLASRPDLGPRDAHAALEFEAYMLKMLLSEMRKGVGTGGLFTSQSLKGYDVILDDALARRAAEAGSFGLAQQMMRQWERDR